MKITLNKDTDIVDKIKKLLSKNEGYCPCMIIKNDDTKCMCKEFRESKKTGYCHCGLYYKQV